MIDVKIEVIFDAVCSWCPIGRRHLNTALQKLDGKVNAKITYLPFELNPGMPAEGEPVDQHLMRRNNWTKDQFLRYADTVVETASGAGLKYDYSKRTHYYNTSRAHRLVDFAEKFDKHNLVVDKLTHAYYAEGMDLFHIESLLKIADDSGLNTSDTEEILLATEQSSRLKEKYHRVQSFGINSIPSYFINDSKLVQGSHSVDFFVQFLGTLERTIPN